MLLRARTLIAAAVVAGALVPAGAPPAQAMATCQAKSLGTHSEYGQFVLVAGTYKGPTDAVDVVLTCGLVSNGVTIDRVTDPLVGPVAALASVETVYTRLSVLPCYEVTITHLDGSTTYYDTCP